MNSDKRLVYLLRSDRNPRRHYGADVGRGRVTGVAQQRTQPARCPRSSVARHRLAWIRRCRRGGTVRALSQDRIRARIRQAPFSV